MCILYLSIQNPQWRRPLCFEINLNVSAGIYRFINHSDKYTHLLVKDTLSFHTSQDRYPIIIGDQRHFIIKLTCLINDVLRTRLQAVEFTDSNYHTSEQSSTFHIDAHFGNLVVLGYSAILVIRVLDGRGHFQTLLISLRGIVLHKDKRKY